MGAESSSKEIRANFDFLHKSDAKIISCIMLDFQILEVIQLWSDIITLQQLDRRDAYFQVPVRDRIEFQYSKLSQNIQENIWFYRSLASHISTS